VCTAEKNKATYGENVFTYPFSVVKIFSLQGWSGPFPAPEKYVHMLRTWLELAQKTAFAAAEP
jgi:hypothetical protein